MMLEKHIINFFALYVYVFTLCWQYVSSSWDKTIRVWNAWKVPRKRRRTSREKKMGEIALELIEETEGDMEQTIEEEHIEEEQDAGQISN